MWHARELRTGLVVQSQPDCEDDGYGSADGDGEDASVGLDDLRTSSQELLRNR